MKRMNKFLGIFLGVLALGFCINASSVEARNSDTYRDLLLKKTYTIKFRDITPEPRITNKDSVKMYGKNDMDRSQSTFMLYKPTSGVVTADGDNRYEELGYGDMKQCRFQRGEDTFVFVKREVKQTTGIPLSEIFGSKKNEVTPISTNFMAQSMLGSSYGSSSLTRYLNALLPDEIKSPDSPEFKYVTAGWLDNGLNYEDYRSSDGDINEAVRYYFNGYNLIKIAAIRYWRNENGVMEGEKTIIRIDEFSPTPTKELLTLPPGVKEKKKAKKK